MAERTDAFVARFGRLQDTVAYQLLPALLDWLAEPVGRAVKRMAMDPGQDCHPNDLGCSQAPLL